MQSQVSGDGRLCGIRIRCGVRRRRAVQSGRLPSTELGQLSRLRRRSPQLGSVPFQRVCICVSLRFRPTDSLRGAGTFWTRLRPEWWPRVPAAIATPTTTLAARLPPSTTTTRQGHGPPLRTPRSQRAPRQTQARRKPNPKPEGPGAQMGGGATYTFTHTRNASQVWFPSSAHHLHAC